jgi:hypothetical protein
MTICKHIKRIKKIYCIGSFDKRIDILIDAQQGSKIGTADPTIDKTILTTVWAKVEGNTPIEILVGTNLQRTETHLFTIQFTPTIAVIDIKHSIDFNSKFFRIDRVENVDEENEVLLLFCSVRGDNARTGNRR